MYIIVMLTQLTTTEDTITYTIITLFVCHPKILRISIVFSFFLGVKMAPRETKNNTIQNFGVTTKNIMVSLLWYYFFVVVN